MPTGQSLLCNGRLASQNMCNSERWSASASRDNDFGTVVSDARVEIPSDVERGDVEPQVQNVNIATACFHLKLHDHHDSLSKSKAREMIPKRANQRNICRRNSDGNASPRVGMI